MKTQLGEAPSPHVGVKEADFGDDNPPVLDVTGGAAAIPRPSETLEQDRTTPRSGEGERHLKRRLLIGDVLAACIGWIGVGLLVDQKPPLASRLLLSAAAATATLAAARLSGLYRSRVCARRTDELGRIALAATVGAAVLELGSTRFGAAGAQGGPVVTCALTVAFTMAVLRWQFREWLQDCHARGKYLRKVLLAGANGDAWDLLKTLQSEPGLGYEVTAIVGTDHHGDPGVHLPLAADLRQIPILARTTGASGVLVVPSALSADTVRQVMSSAAAHGLHVEIWPGVKLVGCRRLRLTPSAGEPFFYVEPLVTRPWQAAVKRGIDLAGASVGLVLCAPLFAVAAALVKLDSRGPAFHRQERVGRDGRLFIVYKLRSMVHNPGNDASRIAQLNERTDGPLFKCSRDPRVTRTGHILRETSIDELPQLWNVLMGSMSLVGPRPALPEESAQFDDQLLRRLTVKPGLTGLWQVRARDNPSFNAYRRLDLYYVDNWSLSLDLSIILSTPWIVAVRALRIAKRAKRQAR